MSDHCQGSLLCQSQFQKEGLLSVERRQIRINDLARMKAMVEGCSDSASA